MMIVETPTSRLRKILEAKAEIEGKNPMSKALANLPAAEYFAWRINGCGYADSVVDQDTQWTSVPMIGYGGTPGECLIRIDKATGVIT